MMIWNKKKLLTDTSSEGLAKSCDILTKSGVSYCVQTSVSNAPMFGSFAKGKCNFRHYREPHSYIYTLYVRRKDYPKAKALLSL